MDTMSNRRLENNFGSLGLSTGMVLDRLLTTEETAEIINRKANTLVMDRVKGTGLKFVKVGRSVRYRASDVIEFVASRRAYSSTSEVAA
jgi:Helix-turn-helix domain